MALPSWTDITGSEEWKGLDYDGQTRVFQQYARDLGEVEEYRALAGQDKFKVIRQMEVDAGWGEGRPQRRPDYGQIYTPKGAELLAPKPLEVMEGVEAGDTATGILKSAFPGVRMPSPEATRVDVEGLGPTAKDVAKSVRAGGRSSIVGKAASREIDPYEPKTLPGRVSKLATYLAMDLPWFAMGAGIVPSTARTATMKMGSSFAFQSLVQKVVTDKLTEGSIEDTATFIKRLKGAGKEAAKGWLVGASAGKAGSLVTTKGVAGGILKPSAEVTAMVTTGAALEGHMPKYEDFLDMALLLGAGKFAGYMGRRMERLAKKESLTLEEMALAAIRLRALERLREAENEKAAVDAVTEQVGSLAVEIKAEREQSPSEARRTEPDVTETGEEIPVAEAPSHEFEQLAGEGDIAAREAHVEATEDARRLQGMAGQEARTGEIRSERDTTTDRPEDTMATDAFGSMRDVPRIPSPRQPVPGVGVETEYTPPPIAEPGYEQAPEGGITQRAVRSVQAGKEMEGVYLGSGLGGVGEGRRRSNARSRILPNTFTEHRDIVSMLDEFRQIPGYTAHDVPLEDILRSKPTYMMNSGMVDPSIKAVVEMVDNRLDLLNTYSKAASGALSGKARDAAINRSLDTFMGEVTRGLTHLKDFLIVDASKQEHNLLDLVGEIKAATGQKKMLLLDKLMAMEHVTGGILSKSMDIQYGYEVARRLDAISRDWLENLANSNKSVEEIFFGSGLGGAQGKLWKDDRWPRFYSPTLKKIMESGEKKMPGAEWAKRIKAWGDKHPSIGEENKWSGVLAYLDSRAGDKSVTREDVQAFLDASREGWLEEQQTAGLSNPLSPQEQIRREELNRIARMERELSPEEIEEIHSLEDRSRHTLGYDQWSERNIPGGEPNTARVWVMKVPLEGEYGKWERERQSLEDRVVQLAREMRQFIDQASDRFGEDDRKWPPEVQDKYRELAEEKARAVETEITYERSAPGAPYVSSHFRNIPNVLLHFRTQDMKDAQGRRGLLAETIQSDWHAEGRDTGYGEGKDTVPRAPFADSWYAAALKHLIDKAVTGGYDWVGWSAGEVQNRRWGKADEGPSMSYRTTPSGQLQIRTDYPDRHGEGWKNTTLEEIRKEYGNEVAYQVQAKGGEGPEGNKWINLPANTFLNLLYDQMLPKFAKKYVEKLGGKYGKKEVGGIPEDTLINKIDRETDRILEEDFEGKYGDQNVIDAQYMARETLGHLTTDTSPVHSIDITPQMREKILGEGQSFYGGLGFLQEFFGRNKEYRDRAEKELRDIRITTTQQETKKVPANVFRDLKNRLFTPEAISVDARKVDATLANKIMEHERAKDVVWAKNEQSYYWWERQPSDLRLQYLVESEKGAFLPGELGALQREYRERMDAVNRREQENGIVYEGLDNYIPHLFTKPDAARSFLRTYADKMGSTWFKEHRGFRFLEAALRDGKDADGNPLTMRTTNPEALIMMREFASDMAITRKQVMDDLIKSGIAAKWEKGRVPPGMVAIDDPLGNRYFVSQDVYPVLKNGIFSKSIWSDPGLGGDVFRGFMSLKNTLVPIKLGLSLFHMIHVATMFGPALRVPIYQRILAGDIPWDQAVKELVKTADPIQYGAVRDGIRMNRLWDHPEGASQTDAQALQYMVEGGITPKMSEVWRSGAVKKFREAVAQGKYAGATIRGFPALVEGMQYPLFNVYIPAMKTQAYVHEVQGLLKRRPELINDADARRMELRKIAQSTDNRFGEMVYSTLFWNKFIKEIGIASSLSLGWNLGFVREYGGGFMDAGKALANLVKGQGSAKDISTRMLFVLDYTLTTAALCGLINYSLTGALPQGIDLFYPRTGYQNPDGTDERVNTPFYAKEFFALVNHWEKEGLIKGTLQVAANKLNPVLSEISRIWQNKDFFGTEIWDESSPIHKQIAQVAGYALQSMLPISVAGVKRAEETGSPVTGKTSWLGFSPAPAYAVRTKLQNQITNLYQKRESGGTMTREDRDKFDVRKKVRNTYLRGDDAEANRLLGEAVQAGHIKEKDVGRFIKECDLPGDVRQFRRLPLQDQRYLLSKMTVEELDRYAWYAKGELRDALPTMSANGKRFVDLYAQGKVADPLWIRGRRMNGVGSSHELDD